MAWSRLSLRFVCGVICCMIASGCSSSASSGTVSGTATYNGKPISSGTVNFLNKNGAAAIGTLDSSGAYQLDGSLEVGEYKVYYGVAPPTPMQPGSKSAPKPTIELPARHTKPETSAVIVTVTGGANVIPIAFKD